MRWLGILSLSCAALPCALFAANLPLFRRPRQDDSAALPDISLLIPARDEAANIPTLLDSLLAQQGCHLEIIVCDDHSTDESAALVSERMAQNASAHTLRLISAPSLPAGWNGKQHACWTLAQSAQHDTLCWIDADVRLAPDAVRVAHEFLVRSHAACVSGFPHQQTETLTEQLLLPLIHFVLLGFLPLAGMRHTTIPSFAAGCGQFMLVSRDAYFAIGGHASIRSSRHDGITLPRAFREHKFKTDLFDATDYAECRMYRGASQTWRGLLKNATEGMASPGAILPFTILLVGGQVLPILLFRRSPVFTTAAALTYATRLLCTIRFRQSWKGALLHPVGVGLLVVLQWQALIMLLAGRQVAWRGRAYST